MNVHILMLPAESHSLPSPLKQTQTHVPTQCDGKADFWWNNTPACNKLFQSNWEHIILSLMYIDALHTAVACNCIFAWALLLRPEASKTNFFHQRQILNILPSRWVLESSEHSFAHKNVFGINVELCDAKRRRSLKEGINDSITDHFYYFFPVGLNFVWWMEETEPLSCRCLSLRVVGVTISVQLYLYSTKSRQQLSQDTDRAGLDHVL